MFSPCVAFCVKITCSGRAAPKRAAASLRQRKAVCSARRTALCPPRPGEVIVCTARAIASRTQAGFSSVVAPASR